VKKRHTARIATENRLIEEAENDAASQLDLELEARRLKDTEAWIKEQSELVKKRNLARIAKAKQLKEEEEKYAARQADFKRLADEASRLEEATALTTEQSELVKKRHAASIAEENMLTEVVESNHQDALKNNDDRIKEQNEVAKKRYVPRIANEAEIEEEEEVSSEKLSDSNTGASRMEPKDGLSESSKHFHVTEGDTAEDAELARKARLAAADDEAKLRKLSRKGKNQLPHCNNIKGEVPDK